MVSNRKIVDMVLFGSGDVRRFTQDTPVLQDVWMEYLERGGAQSLLLEAWEDTPPFQIAGVLRKRSKTIPAVYNGTLIESTLDVERLIEFVLPYTGWYAQAIEGCWKIKPGGKGSPLPRPDQLWADIAVRGELDDTAGTARRKAQDYPCVRLLPMIRMVGLLLWLEGGERNHDKLRDWVERRKDLSGEKEFAAAVLAGWKRLGSRLPPPGDKLIYSVSRNRTATIAQIHSVRTVKADAAKRLFSVDCSKLTWAIIDSGIDATHPAFLLPPDGKRKRETKADLLQRSRIRQTYDFSFFRELLLGEHKLPKTYTDTRGFEKLRLDIAGRIEKGLPIDWEALVPILRIPHDGKYAPPTNGHGTHVAGILGGNWMRSAGEHLVGVCPDISLIDVRVCREDGASNEFVIISALQFLRYLNASREQMAVHGINMSLSLRHDAANYACGRTPVCVEAERSVSSGTVVVVAAGNLGYRRLLDDDNIPCEQFLPVSITDPGNAEEVITVGSTHRIEPHTYGVSYFSSRGPTGDGRVKPDLVAPGEKILAPIPGEDATRLDGTSMASPHVSGAAAMLMARNVELIGRPRRIKKILCDTATDLGRESYFQGHGLLDILRAMQSV